MIHFMLRESSDEFWEDPREIGDPGAPEGEEGDVLDLLKDSHPDTLFLPGSYTWVYDHNHDVLYHDKYPEFHGLLLNGVWKNTGKSVADLMGFDDRYGQVEREDVISAGFMIGRTGTIKNANKSYPVIAFWNTEFDADAFDNCLRANLKEFPELTNQRDDIIVISDESRGFEPMYLKDTNVGEDEQQSPPQGQQPQQEVEEEPAICKQRNSIMVNGTPMELGYMLGKIHNPAGAAELQAMHNAFCGEYEALKTRLNKDKCRSSARILDAIDRRFKQKKMDCNNDWDTVKEKGRGLRNAALGDMFRNPEKIDMSLELPWFHRKKDIEDAWDEFRRGKREHRLPSFLEWLKYIGGKKR